jgi:hypothetical protein
MPRTSLAYLGALCAATVAIGVCSVALRAEDSPKASESDKAEKSDGAKTIELYNGKDLTGWCYKAADGNVTMFDGKTETDDKQFSAKGDIIQANDAPGKGALWTVAEFNNTDFELRFEFRASVNADSGVFIRKPQLQVRDYPVAGPYKDLKKYKPQDWNEVLVIVKGETLTAFCNGEELKLDRIKFKVPPTGGIGLENDRGLMEYRNLRVTPIK